MSAVPHNHMPGEWRRPVPCAACAIEAYVEALRERGLLVEGTDR